MSLLQAWLRWRAPAGPSAPLSVLIFHRVVPVSDPMSPFEVDAVQFDRLCAWLVSWFNVLPLDEAVGLMAQGRLPERAAAITFDDGYADNHDVALPILQRHDLTATFFVATGFLDGGRMWNDTIIESLRRTPHTALDLGQLLPQGGPVVPLHDQAARRDAVGVVIAQLKYLPPQQRLAMVDRLAQLLQATLPDDLMMRSEQVRRLHASGMQVGAHTVDHPILTGLSADSLRDQVLGSRQALEGLLGARVGLFAYPNGKPDTDYDAAAVALVRELGFDAAFTTVAGVSRQGHDRFQLPRFTPWERDRLRFGWRMAQNLARAPVAGVLA
ncbi:MAG: carbohydrate esterase family protein [Burkholderiales bacterium PBB5]|nr:MAG: carbohydrate esterase family protein [Burkholderiales bacterium PBB5]